MGAQAVLLKFAFFLGWQVRASRGVHPGSTSGMFDFDEIEEEVATKGSLGPRSKEAPKPPKPPVDDDDDDDPFGGMCAKPAAKKAAPPPDDDDDDPFGGMTGSVKPKAAAKAAAPVEDDDDPFGGMTGSTPAPIAKKTPPPQDDDDDDPFGGMCASATKASAAKSATGGKITITVKFRYKSQRWTCDYELASGANVADVKKSITAKDPDQASLFKLLRSSTPLADDEKLLKSETLDFLWDAAGDKPAQKGAEKELEITISLAAMFGIRTVMKIPRGLTVQALKDKMAKQDSTGATTAGSFELMSDSGGRILKPNEEITELMTQLTLCTVQGG